MKIKEIEEWYHTTLNVVDAMYRRELLDDFQTKFIKRQLKINDVIEEFAQLGRMFLIKTDSNGVIQ